MAFISRMTVTRICPGNRISCEIFSAIAARQVHRAHVVDPLLLDVDAHLAAALDGEGLGDALEAAGDALEVAERVA